MPTTRYSEHYPDARVQQCLIEDLPQDLSSVLKGVVVDMSSTRDEVSMLLFVGRLPRPNGNPMIFITESCGSSIEERAFQMWLDTAWPKVQKILDEDLTIQDCTVIQYRTMSTIITTSGCFR